MGPGVLRSYSTASRIRVLDWNANLADVPRGGAWSKISFGFLDPNIWADPRTVCGRQRPCDLDILATKSEKYPGSDVHRAPSVLQNWCRLQGERFMYQGSASRPTRFGFQLPMDRDIPGNLFDDGWVFRNFSGPLQGSVVP
jgi:hypothetical protein